MTFLILHWQYVLAGAVAWVSWWVLRRLIFGSPLDNIPGPPSGGFFKGAICPTGPDVPNALRKGNLGQVFDSNGWDFHKRLGENYGGVVKLTGLFGGKELYVFDPLAMHHILLKDQDVYEESSLVIEVNRLMFGMGLISTLGEQHSKQRKLLNPVFSTARLRGMVPALYGASEKVRDVLVSKVKRDGPHEIEMLQWMARVALEMIGQAGFGYSFDPLTEAESSNPYTKSIKNLMPTVFHLLIPLYFLPTIVRIPLFIRRVLVHFIPVKSVRRLTDMVEIMDNTAKSVFVEKKNVLMNGEEQERKDVMSILLKANMEADEDSRLPDSELIAQMSSLTFAGMDTTSAAIARILHILSLHLDVQENLRREIIEAWKQKNSERLTHDELIALPLLDAVVRESLRLHPPIVQITRTTRAEAVLPFSNPIRGVDGKMISSILVPNNTGIIIGILASNRSKELWGDDALEWKPERWLKGKGILKEGVKLPGVYSNLMTFLGGGRACIGFKFSQLEIKVILSLLLESMKFSPSHKEVKWDISMITLPIVEGKLQLPLKAELV